MADQPIDKLKKFCEYCGKPHEIKDTNFGLKISLPTCKCNQIKAQEKKEQENLINKPLEEQHKFHKKYEKTNMPLKYINRTWDNIDGINKEMIDVAKKWLLQKQYSLFLCGPRGTGKSLICSILGKELIKKNYYVYYTKPIRIYNKIFDQSIDSSKHIEMLKKVDYLIIDDITKGIINNDWHKGIIYDIIDQKYEDEKQIIINCNEEDLMLPKILYADVYDRIKEMCGKEFFVNLFSNKTKNFRE